MDSTATVGRSWVIGIAGCLVGAAIGNYLFKFLLGYGFYAAAIPGAAAGLGAGYFLRRRNVVIGIFAGIVALAVGLYAELTACEYGEEPLKFFLTNPEPVTWLMLGLGTAMGFWFGVGRDRISNEQN